MVDSSIHSSGISRTFKNCKTSTESCRTISKINKAAERLEQEFERSPRADELARQLEMKPREVNDAQRISRRHHSLDTPFSDDDKKLLLWMLLKIIKLALPDKELLMDSLQEEVAAALDTLKDRERDVIRMYFGIDREYALTLNEIGEEFGLTRERVRQIKERQFVAFDTAQEVEN